MIGQPQFLSFDDEARIQRVRMFRTVALLTMLVGDLSLSAMMAAQPSIVPVNLIYLVFINGLSMVLLAVNRRGHTRVAGILFVAGLVAVVTLMAPEAGGISSPCITLYFVFALMAGLLLGEKAAIATACICAAIGLGLTALGANALLPQETVRYDGITLWLLNCTYMVVALILLRLSNQAVGGALQRAQGELTQRRRIEQKLELALEEARGNARAKAAFFAAMSHELRTPLNAVIGFAELLAAETYGPLGSARNKEYVQDIAVSGRHLLALVNDVLDISRMEAGKFELREGIISVPGAIANVLRTLEPMALKAGVGLGQNIAPELPFLTADQQRIEQVLTNLVSNAIKFTPKGGRVEVSAALSPGGLGIRLADTGIGIAREDIPKVFERFVQLDNRLARKYQGTGLGLPISRKLVELHGGTLTLNSVPNQGTVATVFLPVSRFVATQERRFGVGPIV